MEKKMNLFHKKIEDEPDNGKEQNLFEHFEIGSEWEENYNKNKGKDKPAKEAYYPNALLFRSLLEGTSFDRRVNKKKEPAEKQIKTEPGAKEVSDISFQRNLSMAKKSSLKIPEKSVDFYKPLKKKKFITEKEQNRLGHIVNKVLGQ